MLPKPPSCQGCVLYGSGQGFSQPDGLLTHGVGLVGEALGEEEEQLGIPFQGKAGTALNRLISRTQDQERGVPLHRQDFRLYNSLWCRPPDNVLTEAPYEEEALRRCRPYLDGHLAADKPRALVALGNQALRRLAGRWGVEKLRGYFFDGPNGVPVVGTYHPSYIMRGNWHLARIFQMDLYRAVQAVRHGRPNRLPQLQYNLRPSVYEVGQFLNKASARPDVPIAFDIETLGGTDDKDEDFVAVEDTASYQITEMSFSDSEGTALWLPWQEPFRTLAARILALPNPKLSWNGISYDAPRLDANGAPVNGVHYDLMHAWHCWEPSLPMGLGYVASVLLPGMPAWKAERQAKPQWYSCADSEVLQPIYAKIRAGLESQGRWSMFERHFGRVDVALKAMSRRGIAVDSVLRAASKSKFMKRFDETVAKIQPLVPVDLRPRQVYKKTEEQLKKIGSWTEGRMIVVEEFHELKPNEEVVEGWLRRKPKPPKAKKSRRKKSEAS